MPLTDAEIQEALKLCDEATEGPWESGSAALVNITDRITMTQHYKIHSNPKRPWFPPGKDGTFIATARTLLPRALRELQRARAVVEAVINDELSEFCPCCGVRWNNNEGVAGRRRHTYRASTCPLAAYDNEDD